MIILNLVLVLHTALAITALVLNTLLMMVMARFTPESFRSFSILLKLHASFDILISVCSLSTMLRAVPCGWSPIYLAYGPCTFISSDICYYFYSAFLASNVVTFVTVLVSFGVRYWILRFGYISIKRIMVAQMGAFIPAAVVLLALLYSKADLPELIPELEAYHPNYIEVGTAIIGTKPARTPAKMTLMVFVFGCPAPLFLVIWIYRQIMSLILHLLERKSKAMSLHTKHMHKQFITILTIQSALPFLVLLGISVYILGAFDIVNDPAMEVITFIIVELPALISPIIVVIHIRSYYEAILGLFQFRISRPPSTAMYPNHILDVPMHTIRPVTPLSPNKFPSNILDVPMSSRRPVSPMTLRFLD